MGTFKPGDKSGVVFNAATLNWALGLHLEESAMDVIDQITLNVITRLGPSHLFPWTSVSEGSGTTRRAGHGNSRCDESRHLISRRSSGRRLHHIRQR